MAVSRIAKQVLTAVLATGVGAAGLAAAPSAHAADADLIARGKYLATAGDCISCHTAKDGQPLAGGRLIDTPFGSISSPNITPDPETGIGSWSDDDFYRAMHEGLGKGGENLYPVFPFPSYTHVKRDDVMAIKAYIFSLPPVHAPRVPSHLEFPFDVRTALDGWRVLFFTAGTFKPDPRATEQVNRGAYLVQGLGHCGECHTPRNPLGATESGKALAGGAVQGWYAPNISSDVRDGIGSWSHEELVSYLKTGTAPGKGVVFGPMSEVVHESLQYLTDADIQAIAAYLKTTPAQQPASQVASPSEPVRGAGETTYLTYCSSCHQQNGKGVPGAIPPLDGNGAVTAAGPENVIHVVVGGLSATDSFGPMPAVGADMTTQQVADVVNYVRTAWTNKGTANATPGMVAEIAGQTKVPLAGDHPSCPDLSHSDLAKTLTGADTGIPALMQAVTQANILDQAHQIVQRARQAAPQADKAALVNTLSAAYCPVAADAAGLTQDQRRWQYERFSQLVYTELSPRQASAN